MISPTLTGISGFRVHTDSGLSRRIADMSSADVAAENGRQPVAISYSTHPSEKTSERGSTDRPLTCSGDMYGAVPSTVPARVSAVASDVRVSAGSSDPAPP